MRHEYSENRWRETALLLRWFSWRNARRHWAHSLLILFLLALGVASALSIRLASRAASESFALFTESLAGETDWVISAPSGHLSTDVLPEIREALSEQEVWIGPVLETTAVPAPEEDFEPAGREKNRARLVGLDTVGILNFPAPENYDFFRERDEAGAVPELTGSTQGVVAGAALAEKLDWRKGEERTFWIADRPVSLRLKGRLDAESRSSPRLPAAGNILVADIASVQHWSGREGQLDRVEFRVKPGPNLDERRERVREILSATSHGRWVLETEESRRRSGEIMTRAFRQNLTVLSLIALLVGWFLILQALDAAVVRRRQEIAVLRSLGVTAAMVRRMWILESLVIGLLGGGVGILLGWIGAQWSVRIVGQTIDTLYHATAVEGARLYTGEAWGGLALAVAAAVAAGWKPARDAARIPPAQSMHEGNRVQWLSPRRAAGQGALWAGLAAVFAVLPPLTLDGGARLPLPGYLAAFACILAMARVAPLLLPALARLQGEAIRGTPPLWVALARFRRPTTRHGLAIGGLVLAAGMAAAMTLLIHSFDRSVQSWVEGNLQADIFVSTRGGDNATAAGRIGPDTVEELAAHPGVDAVDRFQSYSLRLDEGNPTRLAGADLELRLERTDLIWLQRPGPSRLTQKEPTGAPALVTESFARRFGAWRGNRLEIFTPSGQQMIQIEGVFADYGNEHGQILVDYSILTEWYKEERVRNLSVYLKPETPATAVQQEWSSRYGGLVFRNNAELREAVFRIFRQTFAITYALQGLGVLVAIGGIAFALAGAALERRDEDFGLRSIGFARSTVAASALVEGLGIVLAGIAGGISLGFVLGALLIYVVNRQSFGWTLACEIPWGPLALFALALLVTGAVVSGMTGRWSVRLPSEKRD